jgi:hypothetical protein
MYGDKFYMVFAFLKIFKKFLNFAQASPLIYTGCNCKELHGQGQIGGMQWKVRTILPFSSGRISTVPLHIKPYFLVTFAI